MSELRWDPVREEWVVIAPHRMSRPVTRDVSACAFCPDSGSPEVDGEWDVLAVRNRYGSLDASMKDASSGPPADVYARLPAGGVTEVVLYAREHEAGIHTLTRARLTRLFHLWTEREEELGARPDVRYVFIFENRGAAVGVSQSHPHGQIYALPFIPSTVQRMLETARHHREASHACLHCEIVDAERGDGARVIAWTPHAIAFVPYAARLPHEARVYPLRHVGRLRDLKDEEAADVAALIGGVVRAYRHRFKGVEDPPYILAHYPAPSDGEDYPDHHYHVAFYPFQRNDTQLKYLGGVEFASGAFVNDSAPEERARELRAALDAVGLPE